MLQANVWWSKFFWNHLLHQPLRFWLNPERKNALGWPTHCDSYVEQSVNSLNVAYHDINYNYCVAANNWHKPSVQTLRHQTTPTVICTGWHDGKTTLSQSESQQLRVGCHPPQHIVWHVTQCLAPNSQWHRGRMLTAKWIMTPASALDILHLAPCHLQKGGSINKRHNTQILTGISTLMSKLSPVTC